MSPRLRDVLLLALLAAPALAQDPLERLRQLEEHVAGQDRKIEAQNRKIEELERRRSPIDDVDPARIDAAVDRYLDAKDSKLPVTAGFDGKFFVQSEDRDFRLTIGGLLQNDAQFFETDQARNDTFIARRARLEFEGRVFRHHEFRLEADFGDGQSRLLDGYYNANFVEQVQFRFGQFKEPFGHDVLAPWRWHDFIERTMGGENLAPGRDVGAMVHGRVLDRHLNYFVGLFNGEGQNARDDNDDKDLAVRLEGRPFRTSESIWLKGLRIAANATVGRDETEALGGTTFIDSTTAPFLTFSPGVRAGDEVLRLGTDVVWFVGPFTLTAEWMHLEQREIGRGSTVGALEAHDLYVAATYLLTGEDKTVPVFLPAHPFDPIEGGGWGAWEILGRYDWFHLEDERLIERGLATGTDEVHSWTGGLNWYLNSHVRLQFNYVFSMYDEAVRSGNAQGEDNHAVLLRLQLSF